MTNLTEIRDEHPNTMRAVEITQPGGPEVLKIGTRPYRSPKSGKC